MNRSQEVPRTLSDAQDGRCSQFRRQIVTFYARLPRPENGLLLISFLWTVGVKLLVAREVQIRSLADLASTLLPDLVFFLGIWAVFVALYLLPGSRWISRLALGASAVVLGWSILNGSWLIATSIQLQPSVLTVLARSPADFFPAVENHLRHKPTVAVLIVATMLVGVGWLVWRLIVPAAMVRPRRRQCLMAIGLGALLVLCIGLNGSFQGRAQLGYSGQVLSFSSHWYVLKTIVAGLRSASTDGTAAPHWVRAGQRKIGLPPMLRETKPNVVVILLESVSHRVSSFHRAESELTPNLMRIAREGVEMVHTRVPVASTTKAYWSALTASMPDSRADAVESVLVEEGYESLATILARDGYRSAFFEMSRGSFECAPGLFQNLGFNWAWFFENLEDPSAQVGYLGGDDFRMIEPMFEWVDSTPTPFLLVTITSVAHDPYELPDWYPHEPGNSPYANYLNAVQFSDAFVGRVMEQLADRGLLENTLFCVMGDHGDSFRPQSKRGRWVPHEEVIRVPWVMRWPRRIQAGQRISSVCSQLDLTPTILGLLGFDITRSGFEGRDVFGATPAPRRMYFWTWYEDSPLGYVEDQAKYIYWPYTDMLYRYDLVLDADEANPSEVAGVEKRQIAEHLLAWRRAREVQISPLRFREAVLYRHWHAFSSGRYAWAYYSANKP